MEVGFLAGPLWLLGLGLAVTVGSDGLAGLTGVGCALGVAVGLVVGLGAGCFAGLCLVGVPGLVPAFVLPDLALPWCLGCGFGLGRLATHLTIDAWTTAQL